jgi:hypothetical protein
MAKNQGRVYEAIESFSLDHGGHPVAVNHGDTVREGHWLLKGREHLFKLQTPRYDYEVEQATKAPGEKRAAKRTRSSKKAAKAATTTPTPSGLTTKSLEAPVEQATAAPGEKRNW